MNLADKRCSNHPIREAAARCPVCKRFFCRECVTEHEGRMVCVACVAALARNGETKPRTKSLGWIALAAVGLLTAWWIFYYLGMMLAAMPSQFHSDFL